jgi:hypothetical protein
MAVTSTDGTFRLENLLRDVHDRSLARAYGTQTQTVTWGRRESGEVTFEFLGRMAGRLAPDGRADRPPRPRLSSRAHTGR